MQRVALRASVSVYAALLVAPAGTLLGQPTVTAFAVGGLVGAAAATLATARIDPVDLLAGWRAVAFGVVPGVWLVAVLLGPPTAGAVPWARLAGALAVVPGVAALAVAFHARTRRRLDAATTHVTFTARPSPAVRKQLKIAVGILLAVTVVVGVGTVVVGDGDLSVTSFVWLPAMAPVWVAILQDDDGRGVAITDRGLRVQQALHDWDTFAGYERTDDALALYREEWYRSKFAFDVEDIDDPEAVVAAVDRYVPPR